MYLSGSDQQALRGVLGLLARDDCGEREIRERLGHSLLSLLRADQFASFVWNAERGCFGSRVAINMEPANLDTYDQWHQHHDPITFVLQSRRRATRVSEVMSQRALVRTPFFNDFLARDGLYWGLNLHSFDDDHALGDLRIWRCRARGDFEQRETLMLNLIEPAFVGAMQRAQRRAMPASSWTSLSAREQQVARAVREGLTDKGIARRMRVSVPTVRTYLRRIFDKLGIERRSALAQALPMEPH